jgi:Leucine-rich repeat (LRR) protein
MTINNSNPYMTINNSNPQLIALFTTLTQWKEEAPPEENRLEAIKRILCFFKNKESDYLDLSNLNLSSLPDIFNNLRSRLIDLNLNGNQFINLPDTIVSLALKKLHINNTDLITFPDIIGFLSTLVEKKQLTTTLEQWKRASPPIEDRAEAVDKILDFFTNAKQELELSNLNLSSLPDIFNHPCFLYRLQKLYLDGNKFTTLPNTIGNLRALTHVYLDDNELTDLPNMSNMHALEEISLNNNTTLEIFPDIGNPPILKHLQLSNNSLRILPGIANLSNLKQLDLDDNQLEILPDMSNMHALETINLNNNQLTTLPDTIGNLPNLVYLYLENNLLRTLPHTIGNLSALKHLDLHSNFNLSGIPLEMLALPRTCSIILTGCNLSACVRERLREITTQPDYQGPAEIEYSIVDRIRGEERSIQESLIELYGVINKSSTGEFSKEFPNLKETIELRSWLHRLSDTADYQKGGDLQRTIANKIIGYLNQANENEEFGKSFYSIIQDASETCGDRMSLSILHLGIAYQLSTITLSDMRVLADFLKGVWAINMLENIARNKVAILPFFDEVEVYLGYPIKLKKELNLPIDIQEMLYFDCSALKPEDLKDAKDFILDKQGNQEAFFEFLINHAKWQEALSINYKKEYENILDKRTEASESSNPDYAAIEQKFKKQLEELTKKALSIDTLDKEDKSLVDFILNNLLPEDLMNILNNFSEENRHELVKLTAGT